MDLRAYQDELRELAERNGWEPFHTPANLAAALTVEASELQELYLWGQGGLLNETSDEAADVMIFLLQYCDRAGVDLEAAVAAKMLKNWKREPEGPRWKK